MYDTLILAAVTLFAVWAVSLRGGPAADGSVFKSRHNRRISRLWQAAQASMRENNLLQAEKALLTILNLDRKNAAAYNLLGILYAKQKEYNHALECFTAAFNIEENASSFHNLGMVYFNLEQYEKAAIAFKQALTLDNGSALRHIEYAKVLERLGRNKEMLEALQKAAELEPKPEILRLLLKTYKSRKMEAEAEAIQTQLKQMIIPSSARQKNIQRSARSVA
ncbi:tetratricopeptide repeat protein [Candidatus Saccharibacteria bacterium]|nr:tetratricopeptide repeat protein [Candidatus Saccharibacteria bacterium]